jgi:retinol-binding protein 3
VRVSRLPQIVIAALALLSSAELCDAQAVADDLTAPMRAAALDSVRAVLRRAYVDLDTGQRIASVLTQREREKAYDTLTNRRRFADALTADLRSINHDKHLSVRVRRAPSATGASALPQMPARPGNFGLRKVEVLEGEIGYLEVAAFDEGPGASDAIAAALRTLEHTRAIIIDLRRNGGGSGDMSHLLFSHFLGAQPIPTIRIRDRRDGTDTTYTSVATVPGPRRPTVPLYVLTSRNSASAAEEFAFVLRNKGRATLVGERTAGAGHMNALVPIGDGFELSVSTTRVSDAITGAEWERVGVAPHVATEAVAALDTALALARAATASRPPRVPH